MARRFYLSEEQAERISTRILVLGLNESSFASEIRVSQGHFSKMLNGKEPVTGYKLKLMSTKLEIPIYELMGERPPVDLPSTYTSLRESFERLGIADDPVFQKAGCYESNPSRKSIGPIISVANLHGVEGLPPNLVRLETAQESPRLPEYVVAAIRELEVDRTKVALMGIRQHPLDEEDGCMHLRVAPTKYSRSVATRSVENKIIDDLIARRAHIIGCSSGAWQELHCQLHCDALVLTGDAKVLLAQRSVGVDFDKVVWGASRGESMEWDRDLDEHGNLHPLSTLRRGMPEELGLWEEEAAQGSGRKGQIRFLELAFERKKMIYILFSLVELPHLGIEQAKELARTRRTDPETAKFESMDFTVDACVSAIVTKHVGDKELDNPGRFALLLAGLNKYGDQMTRAFAEFDVAR